MRLEKYLGNIPNDIGAEQVKEGFGIFFLKNSEKSLAYFMHLTILTASNLKCLDQGAAAFPRSPGILNSHCNLSKAKLQIHWWSSP